MIIIHFTSFTVGKMLLYIMLTIQSEGHRCGALTKDKMEQAAHNNWYAGLSEL